MFQKPRTIFYNPSLTILFSLMKSIKRRRRKGSSGHIQEVTSLEWLLEVRKWLELVNRWVALPINMYSSFLKTRIQLMYSSSCFPVLLALGWGSVPLPREDDPEGCTERSSTFMASGLRVKSNTNLKVLPF